MKTYEDSKIRSQKSEIGQWKNDKIKIGEESVPLVWLRKQQKKEKLMNQISNFEELECEKSLNINK